MRKMKIDKAGVSTLLAVALIAVIVCCSFVVVYLYTQMQTTAGPGTEPFYGTIAVTVNEDNHLDRGASVSTTSDSYIAYHSNGKALDETSEDDFVGGATFTVGTSKDVAIDPEDNGHFFLKAYTGTDFYLSIQGSQDVPSNRIAGYKYVDVDNDNRLEVVFDVDVSNIADPDPNTKPSLDISIMVIAEDGTTALNTPADQSSIGAGTKTGTIEWQLSGIAEKTGEGLARVYIVQNRTQEDMMSVTAVEIDQVGVFAGGDISYEPGAKAWYVDIGISDYKELAEAFILTRPAGGKSYVGMTVSWESYFTATNQTVSMTLYVETMDADESVNTALSDAVLLAG